MNVLLLQNTTLHNYNFGLCHPTLDERIEIYIGRPHSPSVDNLRIAMRRVSLIILDIESIARLVISTHASPKWL